MPSINPGVSESGRHAEDLRQPVPGEPQRGASPPKGFRSIFVKQSGCPPLEFEERVFKACLYWHAKPFAWVFKSLNPRFFELDRTMIRYLGDTINSREVGTEIACFREANLAHPSFFRTLLRIRVSGRKAGHLATTLLARARRGEARETENELPGTSVEQQVADLLASPSLGNIAR